MKLRKIVLVVLALAATALFAQAEDLSYSGSSTIGTGILTAGAAEVFTKKSGINFTSIEQPGSGKGIQALIDGKVLLAGASRPLKAEEKQKKLIGTIIGYDAIAVVVHKDNQLKNLTKK